MGESSILDRDKTEQAAHGVQRLMGRNLLLCQQLEQLLKAFVSEANLEGYIDELESIRAKQRERTHKMTLGSLVGEFVENSMVTEPPETMEQETVPLNPGTIHLSVRFSTECDQERHAEIKASLKNLVDERNELVHHFLGRYNPKCHIAIDEAEQWLEQQADRLRSEIEQLQQMGQNMVEMRKRIGLWILSDEGREMMFPRPNSQGAVIDRLVTITHECDDPEQWVLLSHAGQQLWQDLPEAMADLERLYGHKTLKALIEASNGFELKQGANGQWFYREGTRTAVVSFSPE